MTIDGTHIPSEPSQLPPPTSKWLERVVLAAMLSGCGVIVNESGKESTAHLDQVARSIAAHAAQIDLTTPDGNRLSLDAPSPAERARLDAISGRGKSWIENSFNNWRNSYSADSTITIRDRAGDIMCSFPLKPRSVPVIITKADAIPDVVDSKTAIHDVAQLCNMKPADVQNWMYPDTSSITQPQRDGTVEAEPLETEKTR